MVTREGSALLSAISLIMENNNNMIQNESPFNNAPGAGPYSNPNPGNMPNPASPPPAYKPPVESEEERAKRANYFEHILIPTLIYAVLTTFFLYNNLSGITMPLFVITTLGYVFYGIKVSNTPFHVSTYFYGAVMLLLGTSSFLTGNETMISWNNTGIFIVLIYILITNFYDTKDWNFVKYIIAFPTQIFGSVGALDDFFKDFSANKKKSGKKKSAVFMYVFIGVVISVPILCFTLSMLHEADAVFAKVLDDFFEGFKFETLVLIFLICILSFFMAYCVLRYATRQKYSHKTIEIKKFNPIIANTVLASISFVYVIFCGIQIFALFLGKMALPDGYTYSEYVHEGFSQLLVVCILNVILILIALGFFNKSKVLNALLGITLCCSFIMLISCLYRVILYISVYTLTFRRIFVIWGIVTLGILLIGIFIYIFNSGFNLFKYSFVAILLCYLLISFAKPDYLVAKYNLAAAANSETETDYEYLASELSTDAAPAIKGHEGLWVNEYIFNLANLKDDGFRKFNYSRWKAKDIFKDNIEDSRRKVGIHLESEIYRYSYDLLWECDSYSEHEYFTELPEGGYTFMNAFKKIEIEYTCCSSEITGSDINFDHREELDSLNVADGIDAINPKYAIILDTNEINDDPEKNTYLAFRLRFSDKNGKVFYSDDYELNLEDEDYVTHMNYYTIDIKRDPLISSEGDEIFGLTRNYKQ